MFKFRNIDSFIPGEFEKTGKLRGKRWYYTNIQDSDTFQEFPYRIGLFKPQRKEFGDKKVFCANHYGEFIGYLLALGARVPSCKAELAHLSRYYANKNKQRHGATPEKKDGCIIYREYNNNNKNLYHGCEIIEMYAFDNHDVYINSSLKKPEIDKNNIEIFLSSVENATLKFYKAQNSYSEEFIKQKIQENRHSALNMIVYDCLYGNNDRHDENWAMIADIFGKDIELYKLYDNERVLGLSENINTISNILKSEFLEEESERMFFSKMTVPGEKKAYSSYKDVLKYLINKYPEEVTEILKQHLNGNTPPKVKMYLKSCEGLPEEYIEFGTKMYEYRYNFAKDLIRKKEEKDILK